ncbi:hypothetical protein V5799_019038, partial [Amblyomma americanum]
MEDNREGNGDILEVCKDGEVFLVDGRLLDRSNCPVHKNRTWCPSAVTGTYTTRHPRSWAPVRSSSC